MPSTASIDQQRDLGALQGAQRAHDAGALDMLRRRARGGARRPCRRGGSSRSPRFSGVSSASRVVPGMALTMARSKPTRRFSSDDLPTFGRPMIAIDDRRLGIVGSESRARRRAAPAPRSSSVVDADAVLGGDRKERLDSERVEVRDEVVLLRRVDLVHRQEHRLAAAGAAARPAADRAGSRRRGRRRRRPRRRPLPPRSAPARARRGPAPRARPPRSRRCRRPGSADRPSGRRRRCDRA